MMIIWNWFNMMTLALPNRKWTYEMNKGQEDVVMRLNGFYILKSNKYFVNFVLKTWPFTWAKGVNFIIFSYLLMYKNPGIDQKSNLEIEHFSPSSLKSTRCRPVDRGDSRNLPPPRERSEEKNCLENALVRSKFKKFSPAAQIAPQAIKKR